MLKSERVKWEIRGALGRTGMTQKALAERLHWKIDRMNRIMRAPSIMNLDELDDICTALGITITFGKEGKKKE